MTTPPGETLQDSFDRTVRYLRISVTERCNLRCVYCMPAEGDPFAARPELLTFDEIVTLTRVFAARGVRKVRLTGGEPLVRGGLPELVAALKQLPGITHVAMTTNAALLARHAQALAQAGLDSVNISLDSLRADRFKQMTRVGELRQVIAGIDAARVAGIPQRKLNAVVMRGFNEDELEALVLFAASQGAVMRFIEFMPIGAQTIWGSSGALTCLPAQAMRDALASRWALSPEPCAQDAGPARQWRLRGEGLPPEGQVVGFIAAVTECFCADCNRLRLTATGGLRACLADDHEQQLRDLLRSPEHPIVQRARLDEAIDRALFGKRERHAFDLDAGGVTLTPMNAIGG